MVKSFPILLILSSAIWAGERLLIEAFSTSSGLINSQIKTMVQDEFGYLWIGTQGGVSRFDGFFFENYGLEEELGTDSVSQLKIGPEGRVWVVTPRGVACIVDHHFLYPDFNRQLKDVELRGIYFTEGRIWLSSRQGLFTALSDDWSTLAEIPGLKGKEITSLCAGTNELWGGMRFEGIFRKDSSGNWQNWDEIEGQNTTINQITRGPDGQTWAATHQGLAVFRDDSWHFFEGNQTLPDPIVYEILFQNEALLVRTLSGAFRYENESWEPLLPMQNAPLATTHVNILRDGSLLVGTNRGVWHDDETVVGHYSAIDGLSSNVITCSFEDSQGNIWVGTNNGLNRLDAPRMETFLSEPPRAVIPPFSQIQTIFEDKEGRLWFPSFLGLGLFDNKQFFLFGTASGLPDPAVHCIAETSGGELYVITSKGVATFSNHEFQPITHPEIKGHAFAKCVVDREDNIWFLRSDFSLVQLDRRKQVRVHRPPVTIEKIMTGPEGYFWVGGSNGWRYFDGNWQGFDPEDLGNLPIRDMVPGYHRTAWIGTDVGLLAQGRTETNLFNAQQGFPGDAVSRVFQGQNQVLWCNIEQKNEEDELIPAGIVRYDGFQFEWYTRNEGLLENTINGVYSFDSGDTFLMHTKGLTHFGPRGVVPIGVSQGLAGNQPRKVISDRDGNFWVATAGGLSKLRDGLISSYSSQDGLPDSDVLDLHLKDGHIWIRTRGGVTRMREHKFRPGVRIEKVVNNSKYFESGETPRFEFSENDLTIYFRGIDLNRGAEKLQYQYKTQEDQAKWFGPIKTTRIPLNNLEPGNYEIQIRAFSKDLYDSIEPARFQFAISPPFYYTAPFIASVALLFFAVLYLLYKFRVRQQLEEARNQKELLVAHDLQMGLMPQKQPELTGISVLGFCQPALEVGGDYFDFFWQEDSTLGLALVDVSGRSLEAAMIAVMTSGLLYGEAANSNSPSVILNKINLPLCAKTNKKTFVTSLFAKFDKESKILTWANAGQCRPLLVRKGKVTELREEGVNLALGVAKGHTYQDTTLQCQSGDLLFFFTDGLTEAVNKLDELFGCERLAQTLKRCSHLPVQKVIESVCETLKTYAEGCPYLDDITMVALSVE